MKMTQRRVLQVHVHPEYSSLIYCKKNETLRVEPISKEVAKILARYYHVPIKNDNK